MAGVRRRLAAFGISLSLLLSISGVARADDAARAEELFRAGNAAFADDDLHAAYDAYRAAWSLRESFDIACNLGRTEAELMLSRDAATHLDYCVRTFSASSRNEFRGALERFRALLGTVRKKVGAFQITSYPSGAAVEVDRAACGTSPLPAPVFVDPGEHHVLVRLPGYQTVERVLHVDAGGIVALRVDLSPEGETPAIPEPSAVAAKVELESPPPTPLKTGMGARDIALLSGGSLALVGLGVGLGFSLAATSAREEADNFLGACGGEPGSQACVTLARALELEHDRRDVATLSFTLAAAVGGATLAAFFLIPDAKPDDNTSVRASAFVTPEALGLSIAWRY
jgi:hypothetical protein